MHKGCSGLPESERKGRLGHKTATVRADRKACRKFARRILRRMKARSEEIGLP